jgi:hypothetical protein
MNALPAAISPCHSQPWRPVFVLGHSRSGTSLTCQLLRDHLGVSFGTESQFIVRYHKRLTRYGDLSEEPRLRWLLADLGRERFFARTRQNFGFVFDVERAVRAIEPRTYSGAIRGIFEQFAASQGRSRWGDKTPEYCCHLPLIHSLFPDAQFIHVVRDGRDVAHSLFKTGFGPKNVYEAAIAWARTLGDIARFRAALPAGAFLQFRYEDLLADPAGTMSDVAVFLGVENHAEVTAAGAPWLRARVRVNNAFKWKQLLTWREIECFEAFAGDQLTALGYPLQFRPRRGQLSAVERWLWRTQAVYRRIGDRRYWSDNWYRLHLRLSDAALPLRAALRQRERETWQVNGLRH